MSNKDSIEKTYARILERRAQNVARNKAEGRTLGVTPDKVSNIDTEKSTLARAYDKYLQERESNSLANKSAGKSMEDVIAKGKPLEGSTLVNQGTIKEAVDNSKIKNIAEKGLVADEAVGGIGMSPEVRGNLLKKAKEYLAKGTKVESTAEKATSAASKLKGVAPYIGPLLKALGIGAAAMGAIGAGQKAMAGDLEGAGLQAADTATDFLPIVGQAKLALIPSELGGGDTDVENLKPMDLSEHEADKTKLLKKQLFRTE